MSRNISELKPPRTLLILRLVVSLSQKDLASRVKVPQVRLSQYEHGLDVTTDHGLTLLQFFQEHEATSKIATDLTLTDLTAPWSMRRRAYASETEERSSLHHRMDLSAN